MKQSIAKNAFLLTLGGVLLALPSVRAEDAPKFDRAQLDFFEKSIRPVLAGACYDCHSASAGKTKGDLALDTREAVLKGGSSGPAVVLGKPDKSLLIQAIAYHDEDVAMPPKEENRLSDAQVEDFRQWIRLGLPDPRKSELSTSTMAAVTVEGARDHWAFRPVGKPVVPKVQDAAGWGHNDIDAFILAQLKAKGMTPNGPAGIRDLLRRVTYGLIGLPPTPEETDAFLADTSPGAFDRVVERLLQSPRYGERWGRHWLDVARYADTSGDRNNRGDPRYPYAWTYRDYVVQSFNQDKPFDRFILEQLAADKLKDTDRESLAALGFLTVGKKFQGQENEVIDDRIDVVTQGFLGLSAACARCHDHKFDPIPTQDYYSLHGIFASSEEPEEPMFLEAPANTADYRDFKAKYDALVEEMEGLGPKLVQEELDEVRKRAGDYMLASYQVATEKNRAKQRSYITKKRLNLQAATIWNDGLEEVKADHPVLGPWKRFLDLNESRFEKEAARLTAELVGDSRVNPVLVKALKTAQPASMADVAKVYGDILESAYKAWKTTTKTEPKARQLTDPDLEQVRLVLYDAASPLMPDKKEIRRLVPGNNLRREQRRLQPKIFKLVTEHPGSPPAAMALVDRPKPQDSFVLIRGERNRRGDRVPRQFLEILSDGERKPFTDGSGRLGLAREIASPENPLTARVLVNRVWAKHFGVGLVESLSDFGLRTDAPVHLELLDHLSRWFVDHGWSIKKLHGYILASAVYQQSSLDRPEYAEIDPANTLLWKQNLQRLDFESIRDTLLVHGGNLNATLGGKPVDLEQNPYPTRRTLYGYIDRLSLADVLRTFDFANPDMTVSSRVNTTVPQQALFMMNSPLVFGQARALIARPGFESLTTDDARLRYLYDQLFQREPSSEELHVALDFLDSQKGQARKLARQDDWKYGVGYLTVKQDNANLRFKDMRTFEGEAWIPGRTVPDARFGSMALTAGGGYPGKDPRMALVRRWTAPRDGKVRVQGPIRHDSSKGDGIVASLIGGGKILGQWEVAHTALAADLDWMEVKQGDTLDFVVTCGQSDKQDAFEWAPVVEMQGAGAWDAAALFSGAREEAAAPLGTWEKFAQILFQTNELIYLN